MHNTKARSVCLSPEEDGALCAESERFTKQLQDATGRRVAKVGPVTLSRMIVVDWLRRRGYALRQSRGLPADPKPDRVRPAAR